MMRRQRRRGDMMRPFIYTIMILIVIAALIASRSATSADSASASKPAYEKRWEERPFQAQVTSCYNCHETLARHLGRPAREHITSAHYRATVTCNECHGGDPTQDDEDLAH